MNKENTSAVVWNILNRNLFFVKNAVKGSALKTSDKFDVFDPETRELLLEFREPEITGLTKMRLAIGGDHDAGSPFDYVARLPSSGQQALRLSRGGTSLTLGNVRINLFDHKNDQIGFLKKKLLAFGTKFKFTGTGGLGSFLCRLKTNFLGTGEPKLLIGDHEIARRTLEVEAKYQEFFVRERCSYAIAISPKLPSNEPARQVVLAFFIGIDRINN
jgi:hypothetical protein